MRDCGFHAGQRVTGPMGKGRERDRERERESREVAGWETSERDGKKFCALHMSIHA